GDRPSAEQPTRASRQLHRSERSACWPAHRCLCWGGLELTARLPQLPEPAGSEPGAVDMNPFYEGKNHSFQTISPQADTAVAGLDDGEWQDFLVLADVYEGSRASGRPPGR